ncbi:MAG: hypothetical protein GY796_16820 [Chloroflexi bacterium]|nr:hypothetical protein [Chloroflexota bacterium]
MNSKTSRPILFPIVFLTTFISVLMIIGWLLSGKFVIAEWSDETDHIDPNVPIS